MLKIRYGSCWRLCFFWVYQPSLCKASSNSVLPFFRGKEQINVIQTATILKRWKPRNNNKPMLHLVLNLFCKFKSNAVHPCWREKGKNMFTSVTNRQTDRWELRWGFFSFSGAQYNAWRCKNFNYPSNLQTKLIL